MEEQEVYKPLTYQLDCDKRWHYKSLSGLATIELVCGQLFEDESVIAHVWFSPQYKECNILIKDYETLKKVAQSWKGRVTKMEKSYNEDEGQVNLRFTYQTVRFIVRCAPGAACKIEEVEVEEQVPAREAHTIKRKKFVLSGDCDPLMQPQEEVAHDENGLPTILA
jgi:hypothetical protein